MTILQKILALDAAVASCKDHLPYEITEALEKQINLYLEKFTMPGQKLDVYSSFIAEQRKAVLALSRNEEVFGVESAQCNY